MKEGASTFSQERRGLVIELAVSLAHFMRDYGEPAFHSYMSTFTSCCRELWRLGVAFPSNNDGSYSPERPISDHESAVLPPLFRMLDEREIRRRLACLRDMPESEFDWLMDAFIGADGYWGEGRFPLQRDWFATSESDLALMKAFERCGFAESKDQHFRWSDAFVPYVNRTWPGLGWGGDID